MGGAYVAKPDAVTTPEKPSGWPCTWLFPGPWPPGYVPVLAYNLGGMVEHVPGSLHNVSATLRDHVIYKTAEPGDSIIWTATINDVPRQLKFDGDSGFQFSLESDHSQIGDYWGAESTFAFDVSEADIGSTLALKASSTPFEGYPVETVLNIDIVSVLTRIATFQCVMTPISASQPLPPTEIMWGTRMYFHKSTGLYHTPWSFLTGAYCHNWGGVEYWTYTEGADTLDDFGVYCPVDDGAPWILGTTSVGTLTIKALQLNDETVYNVDHRHEETIIESGNVTYDYTLEVYEGGELKYSETKQVVKNNGDPLDALTTWCTIDGSTGEITVINP